MNIEWETIDPQWHTTVIRDTRWHVIGRGEHEQSLKQWLVKRALPTLGKRNNGPLDVIAQFDDLDAAKKFAERSSWISKYG